MPEGLSQLEDTETYVTDIATKTIMRSPRFVPLRLSRLFPPEEKLVTVHYSGPDDHAIYTPFVSASAKGETLYNTDPKYTNLSHPKWGYQNPEDLQADYARAYKNSLGVTIFIADVLHQVHGVETHTRALPQLQERWQAVSPRPMEPGIAVLLSR